MKPTQKLVTGIGIIAVTVFGFSSLAYAVNEKEPNSSVSSAQALPASGSELNVSGNIATTVARNSPPVYDVDFYSFFAFAGDSLDVNVSGAGAQPLAATSVGLFGPAPNYTLLDDSGLGIAGRVVSEDGVYTVAVANAYAGFSSGGNVNGGASGSGDYSLRISGISQSVTEVDIDVKPGRRAKETARIKLWKKNRIKVAILGSKDFDVATVDTSTLRFGATGTEETLKKCKRRLVEGCRLRSRDDRCRSEWLDQGQEQEGVLWQRQGRGQGTQEYGQVVGEEAQVIGQQAIVWSERKRK
jgi:hypothetical protein